MMASISPEESPASSSPTRPIRFSLCAVSLACSVVTSAVPSPPSGSSSPVTRSDEPPSVVTRYDSSVALGCCTRTWGGWTVCSSSRPVSTSKCGSCLLVRKAHLKGLRRAARRLLGMRSGLGYAPWWCRPSKKASPRAGCGAAVLEARVRGHF